MLGNLHSQAHEHIAKRFQLVNHGAEIVAYFYTFQVINKYGYIKVSGKRDARRLTERIFRLCTRVWAPM